MATRAGYARCIPRAVTSSPASAPVHTPGDGHIWLMVLGDLIIFGAYFIIFMVYRAMKPQEFLASQQHLNITIGVLNTLVLLASSWFVARSVQRRPRRRPLRCACG